MDLTCRQFLLTNLLLPALLNSSSGASVVNISSAGHRASGVHLDDINFKVVPLSAIEVQLRPLTVVIAQEWRSVRPFRCLWTIEVRADPLHSLVRSEAQKERAAQFRR